MHKNTYHLKKDQKPSPGRRGRIWIDGKEGTFPGYGRLVLLEQIREYDSITKAKKQEGLPNG